MTESGTEAALVDAAEARFATEGIDRASLRAVMRDAGTDPGAIHYHFKGRQALAEVVLDRVLVPLNGRRIDLLDELAPHARSLPSLIEALIRPDVEAAHHLERRGAGRARLMGSIYLHPAAFVTKRVEERFRPVAARFIPHLISAAPHVTPDVLAWRVRWPIFGTLGALLADPDELHSSTADELINRLVDTLTGALEAPSNHRRTT